MWLFTTIGFFSVVAHPDDPQTILIRARVREDMEKLRRHHFPDMEIFAWGGAGYAFRALVSRDEWEHVAQQLAREIDYPNFKNAVSERQGEERAKAYHEVWRLMQRLQSEASGKSSRNDEIDPEHHLG